MFSSFWVKIAIYGAIILVASGLLITAKIQYDNSIRRQQTQALEIRQLKQTLAEKEKFIKSKAAIEEFYKNIIEDISKKNKELNAKVDDITEYLNSKEAETLDRPSSEILKETIRRLENNK